MIFFLNPLKAFAVPSTPLPSEPSLADQSRPWQTFALKSVVVGIEACLLVGLFGPLLESIPARFLGYASFNRWKILALCGLVGAYLLSHVRRHAAEYRLSRLSLPLLGINGLTFVVLMACLCAISLGAAEPVIGPQALLVMAAVLAATWLLTGLVLWVPRVGFVWQIIGSIGFVTLAAWGAGRLGAFMETFWTISGDSTVRLVQVLLAPLAGGEVVRPKPFEIGTERFQVFIGPQCSGYQGIGLITVLLSGYLWWFRRIHRFPQSWLLIPVGIVLIWLANAIRITALLLVGIWISPEIAVDGFHSQAGWIAFLVVGLGIIWVVQQIPIFTVGLAAETLSDREGVETAAATRSNARHDPADAVDGQVAQAVYGPSAVACLLPFLVLTGVTILTAAFTSGFDLLYPLRVMTVGAVLWGLRKDFGRPASLAALVSPGAIGIGVGVFLIWMALAPGDEAATPERFAAMDPTALGEPWTMLWLLFRVVGSTITVPIAEELAFRAFLIRRCIKDDVERVPVGMFTWLSFLVSSLAFGALHGQAWIAGTVAGMAFAAALYQRRRIADAVAAHATTNALLSGYVIATGSWTQWG